LITLTVLNVAKTPVGIALTGEALFMLFILLHKEI
jgi:hypothetical protein